MKTMTDGKFVISSGCLLLHQHLIQFGLQSMKPYLHHTFLYVPPSATRKRPDIAQLSIVSCLWPNVFFPYLFFTIIY
jgi:hypothetical protein